MFWLQHHAALVMEIPPESAASAERIYILYIVMQLFNIKGFCRL